MKKQTWYVGSGGQIMETKVDFGVGQTWVRILSLISCVTVNKFLDLSGPWLAPRHSGDETLYCCDD